MGDAMELERVLLLHVAHEHRRRDDCSRSPGKAGNDDDDGDVLTLNNCVDTCGRTLLSICAWKGFFECCQLLLTLWKRYTESAAAAAAAAPSSSLHLRLLHVDPNVRFHWNGCYGWTSFGVACFCGHLKTIEILRRNSLVNPLLGTEFVHDCFDLSKILHEWGGDPNNKFAKPLVLPSFFKSILVSCSTMKRTFLFFLSRR